MTPPGQPRGDGHGAAVTRVVAYGPDAVLAALPGLDAVRALDAALQADLPAGAVDVVPAARTVLVRFGSTRAAAEGRAAVAAAAERAAAAPVAAPGIAERPGAAGATEPLGAAGVAGPTDEAGPTDPTDPVVLPVRYDGADLAEVASLTGLGVDEVVRRHTAATYTVAFGGFMPGFAYLTGLDPALHVPRRSSPRPRVPAGSVAVAGEFAAVYPAATPGGWRLLGTCATPLFDVHRDPPALLRPGTRVRFVAEERTPVPQVAPAPLSPPPSAPAVSEPAAGSVEVVSPGVLTLVQDRGRPGLAAVGVGRSGAADRGALRLANRLVGNADDAAVLEVLLGGLEIRFRQAGVVALTGAEAPAWRDGAPLASRTATRVPAGGVVRVGHATRGLRVYVAVRGGIDVAPVLGSRATDQLAGIGPAPVRAGDVLPVGARVQDSAQPWPEPLPGGPMPADGPVALRLLPGPRPDWFAPGSLRELCAGTFVVSPDGNRVALRLAGTPVRRRDRGELPSEPLVPGAVQVPPDGQPVVFGADHPVTGGYPVIAVLDGPSQDLAAQLRPGDRVRFVTDTPGSGNAAGAAWSV